jgi:hypothetical protein
VMRFQILTVTSMKMALVMEAVSSSETSLRPRLHYRIVSHLEI